jgi:hypothetical protein
VGLPELSPDRPHWARRRVDVDVVVLRVGQNRSGDGQVGGRPLRYKAGTELGALRYRDRNTVERAVNKLRAHNAVATRYDKRDYIYRGTITVAAILIWLRDPVAAPLRDTP